MKRIFLFAALLTAVVKAGIIPVTLFRLSSRLKQEKEVHSVLSPNGSALAACIAIFFAYSVIDRALPGVVSRDGTSRAKSAGFSNQKREKRGNSSGLPRPVLIARPRADRP